MKSLKALAEKIFEDGEVLDDWSVDYNSKTGEVESNASIEYLMFYKNKYWLLMTDYEDNAYCVIQYTPDEENGYIEKLIQKHKLSKRRNK